MIIYLIFFRLSRRSFPDFFGVHASLNDNAYTTKALERGTMLVWIAARRSWGQRRGTVKKKILPKRLST